MRVTYIDSLWRPRVPIWVSKLVLWITYLCFQSFEFWPLGVPYWIAQANSVLLFARHLNPFLIYMLLHISRWSTTVSSTSFNSPAFTLTNWESLELVFHVLQSARDVRREQDWPLHPLLAKSWQGTCFSSRAQNMGFQGLRCQPQHLQRHRTRCDRWKAGLNISGRVWMIGETPWIGIRMGFTEI